MAKRISVNVSTKQTVVEDYTPTQEELDQQALSQAQQAVEEQREANRVTLQDRAENAIQGNKDFLALPSPSNAEVVAQIKELTKQNNALIRLVVQKLDATD